MSNTITWPTAGSNILNSSDKMANTSSGWDAVQRAGRRRNIYFLPLQEHRAHLKMAAGREAPPQEASRQTSQAPLSKVGTVRNTNVLKWSVEKKKPVEIELSRRPGSGGFDEWVLMWLSVEAARSAGTDLRRLLVGFPLLCQNGIIAQKETHSEWRSALIQTAYLCHCVSAFLLSDRPRVHAVKNAKL